MGADTSAVKNNTNEIQWQVKKSEWKNTKIWKAKGKAMDTNTGERPGYQSVPIACKFIW